MTQENVDVIVEPETVNPASERTEIYNAVARLRASFSQISGGDKDVMEYFEKQARIIVTGVAKIADERDALFQYSIEAVVPEFESEPEPEPVRLAE